MLEGLYILYRCALRGADQARGWVEELYEQRRVSRQSISVKAGLSVCCPWEENRLGRG